MSLDSASDTVLRRDGAVVALVFANDEPETAPTIARIVRRHDGGSTVRVRVLGEVTQKLPAAGDLLAMSRAAADSASRSELTLKAEIAMRPKASPWSTTTSTPTSTARTEQAGGSDGYPSRVTRRPRRDRVADIRAAVRTRRGHDDDQAIDVEPEAPPSSRDVEPSALASDDRHDEPTSRAAHVAPVVEPAEPVYPSEPSWLPPEARPHANHFADLARLDARARRMALPPRASALGRLGRVSRAVVEACACWKEPA